VYVYILANKSRQLYVGVTNNLVRRMFEHVTRTSNFTSRYRITRLVYFEEHQTPMAAINREKRIKRLVRRRKVALIEDQNPAWDDLADGWFELPLKSEEEA
jgi:putative endonuclease